MSGKYKWQKRTVTKSERDSKKKEKSAGKKHKEMLQIVLFVTLSDTSLLYLIALCIFRFLFSN